MIVENWGEIQYELGHYKQESYVESLVQEKMDEKIILCSHPSVVTLGKKSTEADIQGWDGPLYEIKRGGKATYHGPGQVVAYPIINLKNRNNDIHKYLRNLENACILTLKEYGVEAIGNQTNDPANTGVWVGQKKIASIGVAIRRWVTYHGLAINLYHDPKAFLGINPCGYNQDIMTNLEAILGQKVDRNSFEKKLGENLSLLLKPN